MNHKFLFDFFALVSENNEVMRKNSKTSSGGETTLLLSLREEVRSQMIDRLGSKGGPNFKSLNSADLEFLFRLYDSLFFGNQIVEKISDRGSIIEFQTNVRKNDVGGRCGITRDGVPGNRRCVYFFDIAPNSLNSLLVESKSQPEVTEMCRDRLDCFMLIVEHQIIQLLMLVWGYSEEDTSGVDFENFERFIDPEGPLFKCLLKRFFGRENVPQLTNKFSDTEWRPSTRKGTFRRARVGFVNWSNSCYLDSVLMVMMTNKSNFWRETITTTDLGTTTFDRGDCKVGGGKIEPKAETFQKAFIQDLEKLSLKETRRQDRYCTNIRNILASCVEGVRLPSGAWPILNSTNIYQAIAGLSPGLKFKYPRQINRYSVERGEFEKDTITYPEVATLNAWDFLDSYQDHDLGKDYPEIRWDLMKAPIIVFGNGAAPRIKNFGSSGKESGFTTIGGASYPFSVVKARKFDLYLDDLGPNAGKYELVGVVVLHGVSSRNEDGSHYTAYIKRKGDRWYHYDDLSGDLVELESLKKSQLFQERNGHMPLTFFYARYA